MTDQLLWFATRGAGVVSLILTTSVVWLGLLTTTRWQSSGWPRFLTIELHRTVALLSFAFVAAHVVTAIADPYTSLGIAAAIVPLASSYRPLAVGFGVISMELAVAVIVTSLLRDRIGLRVWRLVHWLAYASWPLAILHTITAGSDAFSPWLLAVTGMCIVAVGLGLTQRLLSETSPRVAFDELVGRQSGRAVVGQRGTRR